MTFTVKREMVVVGPWMGDQWERRPFDRVVWEFDGLNGATTVHPETPIEGYVTGLLVCYIDGYRTSLREFEDKIKKFAPDWTRIDVEKAIKQ